MINIQKSVEDSINKDIEAKNTLARGILNLSKYARSIQNEVMRGSKKDVSVQSIVVALSRLKRKVKAYDRLPDIEVRQLSVHSPIVQIIFQKNHNTLDSLREVIRKNQKIENSFFSFSTSTGDIAIIVYEQIKDEIVSGFQEKPKKVKSGLTAVSILFDEALVNESNVGLSLLHKISLRNVVLDAATTTYNEFTLVFESIYLHDVVEVLNPSKVSSPHRFIRM